MTFCRKMFWIDIAVIISQLWVLATGGWQLAHFSRFPEWQQMLNCLVAPVLVWNVYRLTGLARWWLQEDVREQERERECRRLREQMLKEIEELDPRFAAHVREELKGLEQIGCRSKNGKG